MKSVVVICSRNRLFEVKFLLGYLDSQIGWRDNILLVDSSDSYNPTEELLESTYGFPLEVLRARANLPHQRNVAIRHLLATFQDDVVIHFLDDDVIPSMAYFHSQTSELISNPKYLVGARDVGLLETRKWTLITDLGFGARPGAVSKNGLTSPPLPNSRQNMWTPGLAFSYRLDQYPDFRFDEDINFFGEDLEATLRFSQQRGEINLTQESMVLHLEGPRRGSKEHYDLQELLLRIRIATNFPNLVSKRFLFASLLLESIYIIYLRVFYRKLSWQLLLNRLSIVSQILFRKVKAI